MWPCRTITLIWVLARVRSPKVVWRVESAPRGTMCFSRSMQWRRWARLQRKEKQDSVQNQQLCCLFCSNILTFWVASLCNKNSAIHCGVIITQPIFPKIQLMPVTVLTHKNDPYRRFCKLKLHAITGPDCLVCYIYMVDAHEMTLC